MLERAGVHGRAIWLTEVGAPTGRSSAAVSEQPQATIVVDAVHAARSLRYIKRTFLYTVRDRADDPANPEASFGLRHNDSTPKTGWADAVDAINNDRR